MSLLTKAAAGTVGAAGASVVGCYAGGIINFSSNSPYGDGTIGKDYGRYLVGVEITKDEAWWNESYKKYETDKKASRGFSQDFASGQVNNANLKKVCESVYKKQTSSSVDFYSSDTNNNEKYKLASDLLKYCSPLGQIPTVIAASDSAYAAEKVGHQGNAKKLVKATENADDEFWGIQQKWLSTPASRNLDKYFTQFFDGEDGSKKLKEGQKIKDICKDAYNATAKTDGESEANSPTLDDVAKYCSFTKSSASQ